MAEAKPKLSYLASQLRVRCEFTKLDTSLAARPPANLMSRAKSKLESEKKCGKIEFFHLYEIRLNKAWKTLRSSGEVDNFSIGVTLGAGAPSLKGVFISPGRSDNEIARLSIDADIKSIKSWSYRFLKLYVTRLLRQKDIMEPVNSAQIKRLWLRALSGSSVNKIPLCKIPKAGRGSGANKKYFYILEEDSHRDITLVVENVKAAAHPKVWQRIKDDIWKLIDARNLRGDGAYEFLYDELVRELRSAQRGPEHFGIDMPLVILAAMDTKYYTAAKAEIIGNPPSVKSPSSEHGSRVGGQSSSAGSFGRTLQKNGAKPASMTPKNNDSSGNDSSGVKGSPSPEESKFPKLFLVVDDEKMLATIEGFGSTGAKPQPDGIDGDWVKEQLASQNIPPEAYDSYIDSILEILGNDDEDGDRSIKGLTVASGKEGQAGVNPYLREIFREKPQEEDGQDSSGDTDVMNNQTRNFVREGDLIGKIDFHTAPIDGMDVFGNTIPAPAAVTVDVKLSGGVKEEKGQHFIATHDGSPEVDGFAIKLEKGLIHDGNINITSGTIEFDGKAQVTGSIELGGAIDITEDLTVEGNITGGQTYVGGDLHVESGMNTAPDGLIKVKGNITAGFMENSHGFCAGNLTVEKGIIASDFSVKGNVTANEITAGTICVGGNITVTNLGRTGSRTTLVYLGVDRLGQRCVETRTKRYNALKLAAKEYKKQLRLLKSKSDAQMTDKHIEKQADLVRKNQRIVEIIDDAEVHMETSKARLRYAQNGVIFVEGTLAAGTVIHIGKKFVKVSDSVIEVGVSYRKATGISIVDLSELKERLAKEKSDDGGGVAA